MIKSIKRIILVLLLLSSVSIFAEPITLPISPNINDTRIYNPIDIVQKDDIFLEKINTSGTINGNKFNFDIGYSNKLKANSFNSIKINFEKDFNGKIIIYKKINYKNIGEEFFQEINISGKKINTYVYLEGGKYIFSLKENNFKKSFFEGNTFHGEKLYLINDSLYNNNSRGEFYLNNLEDSFLLNNFDKLVIIKDKLSKIEINNIKDFVFKGYNIYISEKVFNEYFSLVIKTNKIEKKYTNSKDDYKNKKSYIYYNYGFGKIFILDDLNNNSAIDNIYVKTNNRYNYSPKHNNVYDLDKILVDDVIKTKLIPFYIILGFLILYFLTIIPLNFYIYKKKKNKFFLLYSVPIISLSFMLILFIMNFIYKGTNDIENKLQINYHKDGTILSKVHIATFTPFGGDYNISLLKENFFNGGSRYYYGGINNEREFSFNGSNINTKYKEILSSNLVKHTYYKIISEYSNIKNSRILDIKSIKNSVEKENRNLEIKDIFNSKYKNIKNIEVSEKKTDFMKEYSFGGESNLNLVIDIYYK